LYRDVTEAMHAASALKVIQYFKHRTYVRTLKYSALKIIIVITNL